jgi:hypothetical protein
VPLAKQEKTMSHEFRSSDGTLLPQSECQRTHIHQNSYDPLVCKVFENEFPIARFTSIAFGDPMLLHVTATCNIASGEQRANEFLAAIVAMRISEGWKLISLGHLGASLTRHAQD